MPKRSEFMYVYGIAPATADLSRAPEGLEDAPVERLVDGELAAIASRLDGERYAPSAIERGTEDVEWLAPRAVAHDRVLTWMSDHGPVVPLPIFSLFSGEPAVRQMLEQRRKGLEAALRHVAQGREYALRVYRIDSELSAIATSSVRDWQSPTECSVGEPGTALLARAKARYGDGRTSSTRLGARIARESRDSLRPFAIEVAETRIAPGAARAAATGVLILDVAFLVAADRLESFQRTLTKSFDVIPGGVPVRFYRTLATLSLRSTGRRAAR